LIHAKNEAQKLTNWTSVHVQHLSMYQTDGFIYYPAMS